MHIKEQKKITILVAPLDWGLGHTTRCIPVVKELLRNDVEVILAGNKTQRLIFEKEFPECRFLFLPGYNIRYAAKRKMLPLKILSQIPGLLRSIRKENEWLKKVVLKYNIDAVISDNRYGLHNPLIPCIFITHQLLIKAPVAENILQKTNYKYINKFEECWIPDFETTNNLAGELSHPSHMPSLPYKYIGALSRMQKNMAVVKTNHLLILLSGPEPQRTILEGIFLKQLNDYHGTITMVRGLPAEKETINGKEHIAIYNHLDTKLLNEEMCKAEYIICRSGYSSVMDIYAVSAKSILIPTPGQTEQEYLATFLQKQKFAISCSQQNFILKNMMKKAAGFDYQFSSGNNVELEKVITKFIVFLQSLYTKHS